MPVKYKFWLIFGLAVILGFIITWIDSRPTWDDTGITAFMILFATAICGFIHPKKFWLWAILVGIGIPIFGIIHKFNFASLLALAFAFIGALIGVLIRKIFSGSKPSSI